MAFPYVRAYSDWKNAASGSGGGDTSTPITEATLDLIEAGIVSLSTILELVSTKGDLLVATADNAYARQGVGSNDQLLFAASAVANGLEWGDITSMDSTTSLAGSNVDMTWPSHRRIWYVNPGTVGGSLRTVSAPPAEGSILILRNGAASGTLTVKYLSSPNFPTIPHFYMLTAADRVLALGAIMIFVFQNGYWVEMANNTAASGTLALVTSLPGSPTDGQECILVDSTSAPTYQWRLRYNSTTTKWHYLGGTPGFHEIATSESTSSTTYAALATAGPLFALPVAGDYDVEFGAKFTVNNTITMSYDIGGTGAVDGDSISANNNTGSHSRLRRKTGLTAVTLTAKYKVDTGTHSAMNRWMRITPVKLG